jgi:hypothetical protein
MAKTKTEVGVIELRGNQKAIAEDHPTTSTSQSAERKKHVTVSGETLRSEDGTFWLKATETLDTTIVATGRMNNAIFPDGMPTNIVVVGINAKIIKSSIEPLASTSTLKKWMPAAISVVIHSHLGIWRVTVSIIADATHKVAMNVSMPTVSPSSLCRIYWYPPIERAMTEIPEIHAAARTSQNIERIMRIEAPWLKKLSVQSQKQA